MPDLRDMDVSGAWASFEQVMFLTRSADFTVRAFAQWEWQLPSTGTTEHADRTTVQDRFDELRAYVEVRGPEESLPQLQILGSALEKFIRGELIEAQILSRAFPTLLRNRRPAKRDDVTEITWLSRLREIKEYYDVVLQAAPSLFPGIPMPTGTEELDEIIALLQTRRSSI
jgi:hypothetical protein